MTTTEHTARIDTSSAGYAQFPAPSQLPKAAAAAVEPFLALRNRRDDMQDLLSENHATVQPAKVADAQRLLEHVRDGGSASTFRADAEQSALQAVKDSQTDLGIIDRLIIDQYLTTCHALREMHDEGTQLATVNADKAAKRYTQAISDLEQARADYISSCGTVLFWRYLSSKGQAVVAGGHEIHLPRGPITKVDNTTLRLLRADAETHLRAQDAQL